ncbi:L-threonylcarbamoyladenylate synthase [Chloroflexota bacterium]
MAVNIKMIDHENPEPQILKRAAELISQGEVIVCPTDTGYAFSANALDVKAIARIFVLKKRSYTNPIHVAVSSIAAAKKYAHINKAAKCLADSFLPGALTMILPRKEAIPAILVDGRDTIGIRIPDNRVILALAAMTNLPLTTTSANISGRPTPYTVEEVVRQLQETAGIVALVLNQGTIYPSELSTIVDLTFVPPRLLRQGRISWEDIRSALQSLEGQS